MEKEKESKKIINIDLEDDENESNANADANPDVGGDVDAYVDEEANHSNLYNSNLQSESGNSNTSSKKNKKITRALKDILTSNSTKFMSNFDPELSNRERRKLTRKFNVDGKKNSSVFDDNGALNSVDKDKDICDCLLEDCPGCHFPCPKCRSCKCGVECRINRKWTYETIENEVDLMILNNSNISAS